MRWRGCWSASEHTASRVLDENYRELRESVSAALDDAVLIGCRADDIRTILKEMISEVESSYPDARPEKEK